MPIENLINRAPPAPSPVVASPDQSKLPFIARRGPQQTSQSQVMNITGHPNPFQEAQRYEQFVRQTSHLGVEGAIPGPSNIPRPNQFIGSVNPVNPVTTAQMFGQFNPARIINQPFTGMQQAGVPVPGGRPGFVPGRPQTMRPTTVTVINPAFRTVKGKYSKGKGKRKKQKQRTQKPEKQPIFYGL
jgi:hypothetical protein